MNNKFYLLTYLFLVIPGLFILTVSLSRAQNFSFSKIQEINTGLGSIFTLVNDFNHDGYVDLAVANRYSNNISILLNDKTGYFVNLVNLPVHGSPTEIVSGDFNEDGHLDIVVTNSSSHNIAIFLGNGDGTFVLKNSIYLLGLSGGGSMPTSIRSGDLNKDGYIDLVVGNWSEYTIAILLGDGYGNFSPPIYLIASSTGNMGPVSSAGIADVEMADINNDGNLDIIALNFDEGKIFILLGNGDGIFVSPFNKFSVGIRSRSLEIADLNKDGYNDVIVGGDPYKRLFVLLNDGTSQFFASRIFNNIGNYQASMALADFNQDGNLDLAAPNISTNNVDIVAGDGVGNFTDLIMNLESGIAPRGATAGDFNNDGLPDLVVINQGSVINSFSGSISLFRNIIPQFIEVNINIKQGSYSNCINLKSKGLISVAILGSGDFNIEEVDIPSIKLAQASVKIKNNGESQLSFEDVNQDGNKDLILHFNTQYLQLNGKETEIYLTGNLLNGRSIKGRNSICFVKSSVGK